MLRPLDTGLMFLCMLLGPSIAGLTMTALLEGRAGLHELRSRLPRWRVVACAGRLPPKPQRNGGGLVA